MADVKKIATRDSYGNALKELGDEYDNIVVLDADLAGATKTATFKKAHPDRFFDCGIQEANMVNVAAGLSTMGLVPFAATFAMFAAGRAYEMVRNTVGYPHLNVKIGAASGWDASPVGGIWGRLLVRYQWRPCQSRLPWSVRSSGTFRIRSTGWSVSSEKFPR